MNSINLNVNYCFICVVVLLLEPSSSFFFPVFFFVTFEFFFCFVMRIVDFYSFFKVLWLTPKEMEYLRFTSFRSLEIK